MSEDPYITVMMGEPCYSKNPERRIPSTGPEYMDCLIQFLIRYYDLEQVVGVQPELLNTIRGLKYE